MISTEEQKNIFEFGQYSYETYVLVSGLFFTLAFGRWLLALHYVMLKFAVKRGQSQACLGMPNVSKLNNVKQVQDDVGWCWLLAPCIVMLNLVQHLTASLSCSCPRTDPETSSG